ncbi:MAG: GAF domain-containing protein, partial [Atribacterota bacterium]|nr:GAF domain-containing protein [Atribacterota bacterium]
MEGVLFEDKKGDIVFADNQALRILGLDRDVTGEEISQSIGRHAFFRFLQGQEGYRTRTGGWWQWEEKEITMMPIVVKEEYLGSIITLREAPSIHFARLKDLSDFIFTIWSLGLKRKFSWKKEGKELLKHVVMTFDLEWSAILLLSEGDTFYKVAEWSPLRKCSSKGRAVLKGCVWLQKQIMGGRPLFFPVFADFPREAREERAFFEEHSVRSLALVPLLVNGRPLGVMVGATVSREKMWQEEERRSFEFLGRLLAHIGETSRVAEELWQAREFLHIILEEAPDVISLKDRESRFLWTSRFHLQVMGVSRLEDIVG